MIDWEVVGAVGEIIGGIAVICTLFYLAVQIRQNTETTRVQIRQAISDAQSSNINLRATDPHIVKMIIKSRKGEELEEEELLRMQFHLDATLRQFENIHAQYRAGFFPESEWASIEAGLASTMTVEPSTSVWEQQMRLAYNVDFRKVVDEIVKNSQRSRKVDV